MGCLRCHSCVSNVPKKRGDVIFFSHHAAQPSAMVDRSPALEKYFSEWIFQDPTIEQNWSNHVFLRLKLERELKVALIIRFDSAIFSFRVRSSLPPSLPCACTCTSIFYSGIHQAPQLQASMRILSPVKDLRDWNNLSMDHFCFSLSMTCSTLKSTNTILRIDFSLVWDEAYFSPSSLMEYV